MKSVVQIKHRLPNKYLGIRVIPARFHVIPGYIERIILLHSRSIYPSKQPMKATDQGLFPKELSYNKSLYRTPWRYIEMLTPLNEGPVKLSQSFS